MPARNHPRVLRLLLSGVRLPHALDENLGVAEEKPIDLRRQVVGEDRPIVSFNDLASLVYKNSRRHREPPESLKDLTGGIVAQDVVDAG